MAGRGPIKWEVGGIEEAEAASISSDRKYTAHQLIEVGIDFQRILGGIRINEKAETALRGLFAAGEASGGVQGAGRMQGAGFLETQVFGANAGKNAASAALNSELSEISSAQLRDEETRIGNIKGDVSPEEVTQSLQKIMWEQVGIVRSRSGLTDAVAKFDQLKEKNASRLAGDDIFDALEAANLLFTARIISRAALTREETRGAHIRSDYPQTDIGWRKHVCVSNRGGEIDLSTMPVADESP
jgi:fumarate reductase (CoM/CoB) subunit A